MKKNITVMSVAVLASLIISCGYGTEKPENSAAASIQGTFVSDSEIQSMITMVNNFRTGSEANYLDTNGNTFSVPDLKELVYDKKLEEGARIRAKEIVANFDHTRPDGSDCWTAYASNACGENIAAGYSGAQNTFIQWKEDDLPYAKQGHRRNMLSTQATKIAVAGFKPAGTSAYGTYWVMVLGR